MQIQIVRFQFGAASKTHSDLLIPQYSAVFSQKCTAFRQIADQDSLIFIHYIRWR